MNVRVCNAAVTYVRNAMIDKSKLIGTLPKFYVLIRSVTSHCVLIRSVAIRYDRSKFGDKALVTDRYD